MITSSRPISPTPSPVLALMPTAGLDLQDFGDARAQMAFVRARASELSEDNAIEVHIS
jgi:hypothetical protein